MSNTQFGKENISELDDNLFPDEFEGDDELAFPDGATDSDYDEALEVSADWATPTRLTSGTL